MPANALKMTRPVCCVIALHCSGANATQWQPLSEMLGAGYCRRRSAMTATKALSDVHGFMPADEAQRMIDPIDRIDEHVYLVERETCAPSFDNARWHR